MSAAGSSKHLSGSGNVEGAPGTSHATSSSHHGRPEASASRSSDPRAADNAFRAEGSQRNHQRPEGIDETSPREYDNNDEASQELLLNYSQDEIAEARAILAGAGYPATSGVDVLGVLQQAGQMCSTETGANSSSSSRNRLLQQTQPGHSAAWNEHQQQQQQQAEEIPVDATEPPVVLDAEHSAPRQQSGTRQPSQRPPWDPSTRLPNTAADAEGGQRKQTHGQAHQQTAGDSADRRPPFPFQVYPTSLSRPLKDSPAALLQPSTRLQRYIKYYERALRDSYRRHPEFTAGPTPASDPPASGGVDAGSQESSSGKLLNPGAITRQPFPVRKVGLDQHRDPTDSAVAFASSSQIGASPLHAPSFSYTAQRRAANLIYDKTGDPRYRFNLLGNDGKLGPYSSSHTSGGALSLYPLAPSVSSAPSKHLRHPARQPQAFPAEYNPCTADRQKGRILSTYAVKYLTAGGSTLPQKTDPVARGQQMRALWQRDTFLENQAKRTPPGLN